MRYISKSVDTIKRYPYFVCFLIAVLAFFTTLPNGSRGATLSVTSTGDSGVGTLRDKVTSASSGDTIVFNISSLPATITLTSGEILINKALTISGPGANQLTISGNNNSRIFNVNDNTSTQVQVLISGLTLTNGKTTIGGGGAIINTEDLAINNCIISGNKFDTLEFAPMGATPAVASQTLATKVVLA